MSKSHHASWRITSEDRGDPAYRAAGVAIVLGQAVLSFVDDAA